ncbi:MAG TPA: hypothetical protein P5555_13480, partial [Candidatus Paceibacterota bacterium]|nr:hypothetical protein [Verrucomicrobiota bacterium]HRZ46195.1 hypothetical protein [Candidatus Paceibacterota bacterium]
GPAALPPKSEVIFAQTLSDGSDKCGLRVFSQIAIAEHSVLPGLRPWQQSSPLVGQNTERPVV